MSRCGSRRTRSWTSRACLLILFGVVSALAGCKSSPELIVETGAGRQATPAEIDEDPWALLPGGAIALAQVNAQELVGASYGSEVVTLLRDHLPLARDAGLDLEKDIDQVVLGVYATAGSDVAAVATGRFRKERIVEAIRRDPVAVHGREIRINEFAGFEVYVVDFAAMVPLTENTLVFGSEIGIRRVLERIEEGRLERSLPPWYERMLQQQKAHFALGIDLDAQPVPAALRTRLAFLKGLRAGRLLGNFEEPGLNVAGTLTYDRPDSAKNAVRYIQEQEKMLSRASVLMRMLKMPRPIDRLEARAVDKEAQVAAEIEGRAIAAILMRFDEVIERFSR